MSEFQNATEPPKPVLQEAAREALSTEFEMLGLEFSNLHPTIRAVIERAAVSTADAKQQVESFVRVVAMADQYSLTDEQKEYALVRAYEQHAERIAKEVGGSGLDASQPSPAGPPEVAVPDGPPIS
jgi:orotidine-5'-phosphate decarboxylase